MAKKENTIKGKDTAARGITRRTALKTAGALVGAGIAGAPAVFTRPAAAQSAGAKPIKIGFSVHRTGIGAVYGRWYERTTLAAVKLINKMGGIAGRPVELVIEDDGTDPKRGAEVVEKLAVQHKVDFVYGTLFSHVVIASAPRAAELKIPLFVASEGYHVPSGTMNRWVFQPGITDVRSQVTAITGWVMENLGKKVAMIYPDYAFGYDHRDFFGGAVKQKGGKVLASLPIPPTEASFTKYFARIPADTEVIYHVMVGPAVLTFVKEMGEHFGSKRPQIFGFIDSLEGVDMGSPGLEFLEGTYFWEGFPRYAGEYATPYEKFFRESVGVNAEGASVKDPKDVSTYAHMFSCWETLFAIKEAVEQSGYENPTQKDYKALIETLENLQWFNEGIEHPQGHKKFIGQRHQSYGQQFISEVKNRKLNVIHRTKIEDSIYESDVDYTKQAL